MTNHQTQTQRDAVLWAHSGRGTLRPRQIRPCGQSWIDGDEKSPGKGRIRWTDNQRPPDTGESRQTVIGYSSRQREGYGRARQIWGKGGENVPGLDSGDSGTVL